MATNTQADLARLVRGGRIFGTTRAIPQGVSSGASQAMGAVDLSDDVGAADGAAAVMAGVDGADDLDAILGGAIDDVAAKPTVPLNVPESRPQGFNRLSRFGARGQSFEEDPLPPPVVAAPAPVQSSSGAGERGASSRLSRYGLESERPEVLITRKAMAAAKVCTPLVAAVSFRPGSRGGDASMRAKALSQMLISVHRYARATADSVAGFAEGSVAQWQVTHFMATAADVLAKRWEREGEFEVEGLVSTMQTLLAQPSDQLMAALSGASNDTYLEVDDIGEEHKTRSRIAASVSGAAWQLYDWVTHRDLAVERQGEQPTSFFSWGLEVPDVVNRLLLRAISECRSMTPSIDSADLRTSHMQASIRRMADLIGAEYVAQTVVTMNWIQEKGPGEEASERLNAAHDQFDAVLEHVYQWARGNYLRIENGATRAVEEKFYESHSSGGSGGLSRPSGN